MKIKICCIVLSVVLVLAAGIFLVNAGRQAGSPYTVTEAYVYPVVPGTDEWNRLDGLQERIDACHVDPALMEAMTTQALAQTVLHYPLMANIYAFNSVEMGIQSVGNYFAGIELLAQREDALACVQALDVDSLANENTLFYDMLRDTLVQYISGRQL